VSRPQPHHHEAARRNPHPAQLNILRRHPGDGQQRRLPPQPFLDRLPISPRSVRTAASCSGYLLRTDVADLLPVMLAALRARPAGEPPLAAILAALHTLIGPDGPPALAQSLASPAGIRARLSIVRLLAEWEQGIADTLLIRAGIESPGEEDQLHAVVTACAATSALRASVQIYRGRYPGRGLDTTRLLPIVEQAFAVLLDSPAPERQGH
jgi:hypothetical protein